MNNKKEAIMVNLDGKPQIAFSRGNGVFELEDGQEFRLPSKEEDILRVFRNRERRITRLNAAAVELTGNDIPLQLQDYQESPEDGLVSEYMLPDYTSEIDELLAEFNQQRAQKKAINEENEFAAKKTTAEPTLPKTIQQQGDKTEKNEKDELTQFKKDTQTSTETENLLCETKLEVAPKDKAEADIQKEDERKIAKAEKRLSKEMKKAEKKKAKEERRKEKSEHKKEPTTPDDPNTTAEPSESTVIPESNIETEKKPKKNSAGTVLIIVLLVLALIFVTGLFIGQLPATIGWVNPQQGSSNSSSSLSVPEATPTPTPEQIVPHISLTIDASPDAEVSGEVGAKADENNIQETDESLNAESREGHREGDDS